MIWIFKKVIKEIVKLMPFPGLRIILLRSAGYGIGRSVYIPSDLTISDLKTRSHNITIGDRVSIGPKVTLITDSSPNNSKLLALFPLISGKIIIEDDAWLGAGSIILPNVTIGRCSVVASGSVCNKNVDPYTVVGGVPARLIKRLDETKI